MNINSKEFARFLDEAIEQKTKAVIKRELASSGLVKAWVATVVSVAGNLITVKVPNDAVNTITKKNKTGQVLVAGDEVYLFSPSGDLTNAFVAVAKNKP